MPLLGRYQSLGPQKCEPRLTGTYPYRIGISIELSLKTLLKPHVVSANKFKTSFKLTCWNKTFGLCTHYLGC